MVVVGNVVSGDALGLFGYFDVDVVVASLHDLKSLSKEASIKPHG
jgi:hypothetical protein